MKENNNNLPVKSPEGSDVPFRGYTLEELKYQRALFALRKEFAKARLLQSVDSLRPQKKDKDGGSILGPKFGIVKSLGSKFFSNLNTLDYIMMGMSLFGTAKKAIGLFRRKK